MMLEASFAAAMLTGLLGSSHCIGMCGGIVTALNMGIDQGPTAGSKQSPKSSFAYQLSYNAGRLLSYAMIGLLAGSIGLQMQLIINPMVARVIAAIFMILLGLYLANWWRGLKLLEFWGYRVWRHLQPLSQHLLPVRSQPQAFMLGMLWGWLPCGLVYAVLVWALTTADPIIAATIMLGFGLGTLPALLVAGELANRFAAQARSGRLRAIAGVGIIGLGLIALFIALQGDHTRHGEGSAMEWPPVTPSSASYQRQPVFYKRTRSRISTLRRF